MTPLAQAADADQEWHALAKSGLWPSALCTVELKLAPAYVALVVTLVLLPLDGGNGECADGQCGDLSFDVGHG